MTERRIKDEPHPFIEERRRPVNVIDVQNRIALAGECTCCSGIEAHATPLFVAFLVAVILAIGAYALYKSILAQNGEAQRASEALTACMNGQAVLVDGAILRCTITKYDLVEKMKK